MDYNIPMKGTSPMKPRIAMVCHRGLKHSDETIIPDSMSPAYVTSVVKAGGLPYLIPLDFPSEELPALRGQFDGLILIGGGDVETARYGGDESIPVGGVHSIRDEVELLLAKLAFETDWPVLGICRGEQVMNIAAGGTLYTDIPTEYGRQRFNHAQPFETPRDALIHDDLINPGSRLQSILGMDRIAVNSFHHQAVRNVGAGFVISAYSEDGIPEAIERPAHPFALGVQWHPECLQSYDDHMKIFRAFIDACRK